MLILVIVFKNISIYFWFFSLVSSAFTDKKLITNDIMYSNYICHVAWFSSQKYSEEKIISLIMKYNNVSVDEDNYAVINCNCFIWYF